MIGLFDGSKFRYYRNLADFFSEALTKKYSGVRFFAHYGGKFDVHFLFDWLRANAPEIDISICCSGSCVISMTIKIGSCYWRFCDSYRLMPASLEVLTRDFDVAHKKLPFAPTDPKYLEHDCRGLYEVLEQFFDLYDMTSETLASHAMRIFRRNFLRNTYNVPSAEVETFARKCYTGGRVEIYRFDKATLNSYDVNSMYPFVMLESVPVEFLTRTKRLIENSEKRFAFYRAKVNYPDVYLPALPVCTEKLYFPVGVFEGYFTSIELGRAINDGAAVTIDAGYLFMAEPLLAEFSTELYKLKQTAEREGKLGLRFVAKILLNSLYGKFGQRREQRTFMVDNGQTDLYPLLVSVEGKPVETGIGWKWTVSRGCHILPHIAAAITARARLVQLSYLSKPRKVWYGDTDSMYTDERLPTSDKLGGLKDEGSGEFQAFVLKGYTFKNQLKLKGIPHDKYNPEKERELQESFLAGNEIHFRRHAGFLESIRAGKQTVRMIDTKKQRNTETKEKRARFGPADTRPWRYAEIA